MATPQGAAAYSQSDTQPAEGTWLVCPQALLVLYLNSSFLWYFRLVLYYISEVNVVVFSSVKLQNTLLTGRFQQPGTARDVCDI